MARAKFGPASDGSGGVSVDHSKWLGIIYPSGGAVKGWPSGGFLLWLRCVVGGAVYNPFGKLVGVGRALAFAYGHTQSLRVG